jgi:excisionase family DNA binding protein
MSGKGRSKDLFTASEVARFCQVDLKTIHNWADRGEIEHFRTPGRHLRFRRDDVLDFLRRVGYPLPEELRPERPRVVVLHPDDETRGEIARSLRDEFDVAESSDALSCLVRMGADAPDALVLAACVDGLDARRVIQCLHADEATRRVRVLVLGGDDDSAVPLAADIGASGLVRREELDRVSAMLGELLCTSG